METTGQYVDYRFEIVGGSEKDIDKFIEETNEMGVFWFNRAKGEVPFSSLFEEEDDAMFMEEIEEAAKENKVNIRRRRVR